MCIHFLGHVSPEPNRSARLRHTCQAVHLRRVLLPKGPLVRSKPLFDVQPRPLRLDSDVCRNLASYGDGCTNGTDNRCRFGILYADGSRTAGVYSRDRLTLTRVDTVNNFRFGCGHDHRSSATYDGLLALGRLPMSLVAQTSSVYRGAFSYCLPAVNSRSGFLALGVRRSATSGFVFTPLRSSNAFTRCL